MSDDLFNVADQAAPEQSQQEAEATQETVLNYVGEGKKYSDISKLDSAYSEAEAFIEKLKTENSELRGQLEGSKKLEDLLGSLKQTEEQSDDPTATREEIATVVQQLVERTLDTRTQKEQMQSNAKSVVSALRSKYGEKAQEELVRKSQELGTDLSELAMKSPKAALKLLGLESGNQVTPPAAQSSSVNTEAVLSTQKATEAKQGSFRYWSDMRKAGKISMDEMLRQQHKSAKTMSREDYFA